MVDLNFLEKFTKGDAKKMKRYISLYLDIAPKTFARMKEDLVNSDFEQFRINAHSLKPQTDFMGIVELKDVLVEIETRVKNNEFTHLSDLYNKALELHKKSEIFLTNYINKM